MDNLSLSLFCGLLGEKNNYNRREEIREGIEKIMKYTIHELTKQLGISQETIRHYRNLGLIMPERDSENGYFYYDDWDAFQLLFIKRYRSMDLSLGDVQNILDGKPAQEQLHWLQEKESSLERQIAMLEADLEHTQRIVTYMQMTMDKQGVVELVNWTDDFFALYVLGNGCKPVSKEIIQPWIAKMPYTYPTVKIPMEQLNDVDRTEPYDVQIGLACIEKTRRQQGLEICDAVEIIPGGLSIRTFISVENPFVIYPKDIEDMRRYVYNHNYQFINNSSGWIMVTDYSQNKAICQILLRVRIG
jgi:DNA-binding transcriptional MerR regulator